MAGKVLKTAFDSRPFSNGVYRFGSKVSVCAMPPAIHNTTRQSAVAGWAGGMAPKARGAPADKAPRVAALAVLQEIASVEVMSVHGFRPHG